MAVGNCARGDWGSRYDCGLEKWNLGDEVG